MKKKIGILLCMFMFLVGCGPDAPKADEKLICLLQTENEGQTLELKVEISYDSEKDVVTKGVFKTKYDNLVKNDTNGNILTGLVNKQTKIEDVEGVKVDFNVTDTCFDYKETWDYSKVDVKSAIEADEEQSNYIENENYSVKKIKEYYTNLGFSCDIKKIKDK